MNIHISKTMQQKKVLPYVRITELTKETCNISKPSLYRRDQKYIFNYNIINILQEWRQISFYFALNLHVILETVLPSKELPVYIFYKFFSTFYFIIQPIIKHFLFQLAHHVDLQIFISGTESVTSSETFVSSYPTFDPRRLIFSKVAAMRTSNKNGVLGSSQ